MSAQWEQIAAQKQGERLSKIPNKWRLPTLMNPPSDVTAIPRACGLLSEKELDITENHTAQGIVAAVVSKKYTAEEVALAFCKVSSLLGIRTWTMANEMNSERPSHNR
jgi:amidase